MNQEQVIREYFRAETAGDVEAVARLCHEAVIVRNAAQPSQQGKQGVRAYVSDFKARTSRREFQIHAIAIERDVAFAWWDATLEFVPGARIGPVVAQSPFEVRLPGICRFHFRESLIDELDVFHETTSVLQAAQATTV
jgi:hypothetical protein